MPRRARVVERTGDGGDRGHAEGDQRNADEQRSARAPCEAAPCTRCRDAIGRRSQLHLELAEPVAHALALSADRSRARPRLTRWRTTASEHSSVAAISE